MARVFLIFLAIHKLFLNLLIKPFDWAVLIFPGNDEALVYFLLYFGEI